MLGPVLFVIYINDLDVDLVSKIGKFADDTKMYKSVRDINDVEILRSDLNKLDTWAKNWQMEFNKDKCVVIHLGRANNKMEYKLGENLLKSSTQERNLGVIVDHSMKFSEQCNLSVKNANSILGIIRRSIKNKNKHIIVKLYKGLVRPKLEYCVQAWRPFLKGKIENLEKVQRRATRMIEECTGLDYTKRLTVAGLTSLEDSKVDYKTFLCFMIIIELEDISAS